MTGGLIQIVAYGSQDLFLTGIPEITFFKYIYKRYTNFAEETIDLKVDGTCNFGEEITCTFPKNGDVIKNIFVKIDLPSVNLTRTIDYDLIKKKEIDYNNSSINYNNLSKYYTYLYSAINVSEKLLAQKNSTFSKIKELIESDTDVNTIKFLKTKLNLDPEQLKTLDFLSDLNKVDSMNVDESQKVSQLEINIKKYKNESLVISKIMQDDLIEKKRLLDDAKNTNNNFSWVENIGYKILNTIDIEIGGNIIDRQYGKWLFIWNELAEHNFKKKTIDKLVGNLSDLNDFNRNTKNSYSLYIPLKFWFNREYGSALPLISMRYQEITLRIKLSNLKDCIYSDYENTNNDLIDKIKLNNIYILCDYIYLDSDERRKFAQASHEYLIEQTKNNIFTLQKSKEINIELDFYHPLKYLVWTIQSSSDLNKNLHFKYGVNKYDIVNNFPELSYSKNNPISECRMELNGVNRFNFLSGEYFNYVQPYECFKNTPSDGINCYSFSLNPLEIQPSGTCNFSKLNKKTLNLIISDEFYENLDDNDSIIINVYAVNYNVLRFNKGLSGLGFNY